MEEVLAKSVNRGRTEHGCGSSSTIMPLRRSQLPPGRHQGRALDDKAISSSAADEVACMHSCYQ
jgi:hypothetical protein